MQNQRKQWQTKKNSRIDVWFVLSCLFLGSSECVFAFFCSFNSRCKNTPHTAVLSNEYFEIHNNIRCCCQAFFPAPNLSSQRGKRQRQKMAGEKSCFDCRYYYLLCHEYAQAYVDVPYVVCSCTLYSSKYYETQMLTTLQVIVIRKFCVYALFLFTLHINFNIYTFIVVGRAILLFYSNIIANIQSVSEKFISVVLILHPEHIFDSTLAFFWPLIWYSSNEFAQKIHKIHYGKLKDTLGQSQH